jgi:hypothetical protein
MLVAWRGVLRASLSVALGVVTVTTTHLGLPAVPAKLRPIPGALNVVAWVGCVIVAVWQLWFPWRLGEAHWVPRSRPSTEVASHNASRTTGELA